MKKIVIIAGVGFRTSKSITALGNIFIENNVKVNIGTAIAKLLASNGYDLIILSKSREKLEIVKKSITLETKKKVNIDFNSIDLLNSKNVEEFVNILPKDRTYHYIHSAGLSAGSYNFENPYLSIDKTPDNLPSLEFEAVTKSLLITVKQLIPLFERQNKSKIIVINSMSGIRPFPYGFSHSSAKAGLHNAVRSLALELTRKKIFITEINPGMVNTGHYDSPEVQISIKKISKLYGYTYNILPMMPPESVAETVLLTLRSKAHVLSINLVAEGQIPHMGS